MYARIYVLKYSNQAEHPVVLMLGETLKQEGTTGVPDASIGGLAVQTGTTFS